MPTKRTRLRRDRAGAVTDHVVELYRRLVELRHMDLARDDPRMMGGGEIAELEFEIHRHFGLLPHHSCEDFQAVGDQLARAAGIERRGSGYDIT